MRDLQSGRGDMGIRQSAALRIFGLAALSSLWLVLTGAFAWAQPDEWAIRPAPSFQQIDWDYPFILEGFDQDILTCTSIAARFEGDKVVLSCKGATPPATNVQAPKDQPPPFDAVSYLEKRYGAPKRSTSKLRSAFSLPKWMFRSPKGRPNPDLGIPADSFKYPVPTFCQTYYQNGEWRTLLSVTMYYRPRDLPTETKNLPNKGTFAGLLPYYTESLVLCHRKGVWKLLKANTGFVSHSLIACPNPGWRVSRLWRLPNGELVFLDVTTLLLGVLHDNHASVAYAYQLENGGNVEPYFEKMLSKRSYSLLPEPGRQVDVICSLQAPQRENNMFTSVCHYEVQRINANLWTSTTASEDVRPYARTKLRGVSFPFALYY